jgi:hypothetical protein
MPGSARFHDSGACVAVGSPCPSGDFPDEEDLPTAEAVLYVRHGAADGDGARERPFGTIAGAMRLARPGSIVVLAKGDYPELVTVFGGVRLIGACAAETRLVPARAATEAVLMENAASLENVTVAPDGLIGIHVVAEAELRSVIVAGATAIGVRVSAGAKLEASALVVSDLVPQSSPELARAISVEDAEVTLDRVAIEHNAGDGIVALGSTVTALDLRVVDTGFGISLARGMNAQDDAVVEVRRGYMARFHGAIATAIGEGARIRLEDTLIAEDATGDAESAAVGIVAQDHSTVELERVRFDDIGLNALSLVETSTATISDVQVRGVGVDHDFGVAFGAGPESSLTFQRVQVADAEVAALFASGDGAAGIESGAGPLVTIDDLTVLRSNHDGTNAGYGIAVAGGTTATLHRVAIADVRGNGVLVSNNETALEADDLAITSTSAQGDERYGRALEVQMGGTVTIDRGRFEAGTEIAAFAHGEGTRLTMQLAALRRTRARACAASTCMDSPAGVAVGAYASAAVRLEAFEIDGAPLCGAQLADAATIDLELGAVRNTNVGVCVQVEGFDLERVTGSVVYEDNEINVESTSHDVPTPAVLDLSL